MRRELVVLVVAMVVMTTSAQFMLTLDEQFEFEEALSKDQGGHLRKRATASMGESLYIADTLGVSEVRLTLCVVPYRGRGNVTVTVQDVQYSNDGYSDDIFLRFNNHPYTSFKTPEALGEGGAGWDKFHNTGPLGSGISLQSGLYILSVWPKTDRWGVELDRIRFRLTNQDPRTNFVCRSKVYFR